MLGLAGVVDGEGRRGGVGGSDGGLPRELGRSLGGDAGEDLARGEAIRLPQGTRRRARLLDGDVGSDGMGC